MKIKYVEERFGITRKNIRFYEEQGLLSPERADNGYREYGQEDIRRLMQVKLLRKLGVSIEEIKKLFQGAIRLEDCLDRHLDALEREKERLTQMQAISEHIIASHATLQSLDTESCLDEVERVEKEGTGFMEVERTDIRRKKRQGALVAGIFMLFLTTVIPIAFIIWMNMITAVPLIATVLLIVLTLPVGFSIVSVMVKRMKEVEGGEEDEASKY